MLAAHQRSVCLSWVALDLPVRSLVETTGTLYQKTSDQFDLLFTEPPIQEEFDLGQKTGGVAVVVSSPRLLWFEISPYRIKMTMQDGKGNSYWHRWERGVYGISRYWLGASAHCSLPLRNFTRQFVLDGWPLPEYLRLEYELWAGQEALGRYVLDLQIQH
jgi:hypothetical protein